MTLLQATTARTSTAIGALYVSLKLCASSLARFARCLPSATMPAAAFPTVIRSCQPTAAPLQALRATHHADVHVDARYPPIGALDEQLGLDEALDG